MMKHERCISISSTSTEASADGDGHSYTAICRRNWERCEFCDKRFSNKYVLLKHNVTHIIIPLIKLTTHECHQCLHHFTSVEELTAHIAKKHQEIDYTQIKLKFEESIADKIPEILQSIVDKQVYVKCDDELKDVFVKGNKLRKNGCIQSNGHDGLETSLKSEPICATADTPPKSEPVSVTADTPPKSEPISVTVDRPKCEPISLKGERVSLGYDNLKRGSSPTDEEKESIRQRLLFEDDVEDNLFKDLTTDCHVNHESICTDIRKLPIDILSNEIHPELTVIDIEGTSSGSESISNAGYTRDSLLQERIDKMQQDTTDLLRYGKAVHYDVLMEDEACTCRWCGKDFPNRFELLRHEPKHILLKPKQWRSPLCCVCERYIAGNYHNLRKHMEKNHPDEVDVEFTYATYRCTKCTHQYHNYHKHLKHFHEYYKCEKCMLGFDTQKLLDNHECGKINTDKDVLSVKSESIKSNHDAVDIQPDPIKSSYRDAFVYSSEPIKSSCRITSSVMQLCEMCFSFMKIYMQNRQNYEVVGEKSELGVRQNCDKCNNLFFEVTVVKRKSLRTEVCNTRPRFKVMSNIDRLKKMQSRLKMMKQRNKY